MLNRATDDLQAVRAVVDALTGFDPKDQQRVFRWAAEKLGLPQPFESLSSRSVAAVAQQAAPEYPAPLPVTQDIKSFVASKAPKTDIEFAATIAYYYRFVAPAPREHIGKAELVEACRAVNWPRPSRPDATLHHAFTAGVLDSPKRGEFAINAVGENLVAMTLPGGNGSPSTPARTLGPRNAGRTSRNKKQRR
jgi:hypothetical protein